LLGHVSKRWEISLPYLLLVPIKSGKTSFESIKLFVRTGKVVESIENFLELECSNNQLNELKRPFCIN